jgi:hypothetical protein
MKQLNINSENSRVFASNQTIKLLLCNFNLALNSFLWYSLLSGAKLLFYVFFEIVINCYRSTCFEFQIDIRHFYLCLFDFLYYL